jgi:hypothetical protein
MAFTALVLLLPLFQSWRAKRLANAALSTD